MLPGNTSIFVLSSTGMDIFLIFLFYAAGIREMFEKTRFYESVDRHNVYITVHDAVLHSIYEETPSSEVYCMTSLRLREYIFALTIGNDMTAESLNFISEGNECFEYGSFNIV